MKHQADRSALVAGGSGLVGGHLLRRLGADPRYDQVISFVRRETAATPGVDTQVVDFERLDALVPPPASDAFCCLGTTRRAAGSAAAFRRVDFDYIVAFARLARRAGAHRFLLVSSLGASARSPLLYPRTKGECEAAITSIGFTTVVILRPSFLLGERREGRPAERLALRAGQLIAPVLVGPLRRYAPVHAAAVARTLTTCAASAGDGVTIIESDRIR